MEKRNYVKLMLMLCVSFAIMYGVMFLNVDKIDDIYLSLTRTYMALLMVSPMAVMMIVMMGNMYANKKLNIIIITTSTLVFLLAVIFLRNQVLIGDKEYMQAMIPHHSSAILTSKHSDIKDPEIKQLSQHIILSQQQEIEQMKHALSRMKKN